MRAAVLKKTGEPLHVIDWPAPAEELGRSIIQVKYAGLNHRDLWITKGQYAGIQTPIILGSDLAGTCRGVDVIANPAFNWGDDPRFQSKSFEILGLPSMGTLAEQVLVPDSAVFPVPGHLSAEQAASLPLAGLTAYRALMKRAQAWKEDKVLITGIGGGVALFALQFALALGMEVYVSSSSQNKIERAVKMGARAGVNYLSPDWEKELLNQSSGIDVVIDGASGSDFSKLVKVCNPGARIVIYGGTRGAIQNLSPQPVFWKQLSILGSTMGSPSDFAEMVDLVNQYKIIPIVDSVFELDNVNHAFARMESGLQFGKIIVKVHN